MSTPYNEQMGMNVYDPWDLEKKVRDKGLGFKQIENYVWTTLIEIWDTFKKEGRPVSPAIVVCAIRRDHPVHLHRWFNVSHVLPPEFQAMRTDLRFSETYNGGIGNIEALLGGSWRIATAEETNECKKRDEADTAKAKKKNAIKGTAWEQVDEIAEHFGMNK